MTALEFIIAQATHAILVTHVQYVITHLIAARGATTLHIVDAQHATAQLTHAPNVTTLHITAVPSVIT